MSAFYLASDEFHAVVDNISHGFVAQPRKPYVLARPFDHTFAGVDVTDACARRQTRDGRPAGVREQVKYAYRSAGILVGYNPFFGKFFKVFPTSAAALAADILGVESFIILHIRPCAPYDLRVGSEKNDVFPTLQLIPVAGCENDVIFPFIGYFHAFLTTNVILSPFISKYFV